MAHDGAGSEGEGPTFNRKVQVWLVLGLVQLCYCIWHVLAKRALLSGLDPLVLALYRELMACGIMHVAAYRIDGRKFALSHFQLFDLPSFPSASQQTSSFRDKLQVLWLWMNRGDLLSLLLLGLFSFGNIVGFIVALKYITALNASLLHPAIPVMAAVIATVAKVEHLSRYGWIGVVVCAAGAMIVIGWGVQGDDTTRGDDDDGVTSSSKLLYGNVILVLQCLSMAALLVSQKPLLRRIPPTSLTAGYYTVATVLTFITTLSTVDPNQDSQAYHLSTTDSWIALIYGAVVSVSFVYVALSWATKHTTPSTVAVSMTLQPPLNAILSMLLLGRTSITVGECLGGVLIVAGLVLTVRNQSVSQSGYSPALGAEESSERKKQGCQQSGDHSSFTVSTLHTRRERGSEDENWVLDSTSREGGSGSGSDDNLLIEETHT